MAVVATSAALRICRRPLRASNNIESRDNTPKTFGLISLEEPGTLKTELLAVVVTVTVKGTVELPEIATLAGVTPQLLSGGAPEQVRGTVPVKPDAPEMLRL